jgi:hypothetical protein
LPHPAAGSAGVAGGAGDTTEAHLAGHVAAAAGLPHPATGLAHARAGHVAAGAGEAHLTAAVVAAAAAGCPGPPQVPHCCPRGCASSRGPSRRTCHRCSRAGRPCRTTGTYRPCP